MSLALWSPESHFATLGLVYGFQVEVSQQRAEFGFFFFFIQLHHNNVYVNYMRASQVHR